MLKITPGNQERAAPQVHLTSHPPFPLQEFFPLQPWFPESHPPCPLQLFFPAQSCGTILSPALALAPAWLLHPPTSPMLAPQTSPVIAAAAIVAATRNALLIRKLLSRKNSRDAAWYNRRANFSFALFTEIGRSN
jgi:hypothetical protein